jgi:hypothetical protein
MIPQELRTCAPAVYAICADPPSDRRTDARFNGGIDLAWRDAREEAMRRGRIDFIGEYCDRWCERCAFTERCSHFAVHAAIAMCDGDFRAAIELAVGTPQPVHGERQPTVGERLAEEFAAMPPPTDKELEEISREYEERSQRVDASVISQASMDYAVGSSRWLEAHDALRTHEDPALREAVTVIEWDLHFIPAKLRRALNGLDEFRTGEAFEKDPVQNDWNGSAKVALISIVRSEQAWAVIHAARHDDGAAALRDALRALGAAVRREFPDATRFRRPGFDA